MGDIEPSELTRDAIFKAQEPPCCLRIHPRHPHLVFLGTYTLVEGTNRKGSIEVWDTDTQTLLQTYPTHGAVLDIKLSPRFEEDSMLVTCHSTGNISVWKVGELTELTHLHDHQLFEEPVGDSETLITSLNFHMNVAALLVFTTTTGVVGTLNLETGSCQILAGEHSLEAWYADFHQLPQYSNVVLSGGDDMQLVGHDIRQEMPVFQTKRLHDAGIVSILTPREGWSMQNEHRVWTGGYDDNLCVVDLRMGNGDEGTWGMPPLGREKHNLGGGVWRLMPVSDNRVITCNMYDGGRVLNHQDGEGVQVTSKFKGDHESITYGGDWMDGKLVSCSFYDKVVQVWKV